jgi:hypothetical protein
MLFDTLRYIKALKQAGFTTKQAAAVTQETIKMWEDVKVGVFLQETRTMISEAHRQLEDRFDAEVQKLREELKATEFRLSDKINGIIWRMLSGLTAIQAVVLGFFYFFEYLQKHI